MEDDELYLKPLQCPKCKKVYSEKTRQNYLSHLKTCGWGKYQCHICEKNYFSPLTLKKHLKTHVAGFGYACQTCGKKFQDKFKRSLHANIHRDKVERENERLKCKYCDKTFAWRSSLSRHLQSHFKQETETYICGCGNGYSVYSKYYFHKKSCIYGRKKVAKAAEGVKLSLNLHHCQLCNLGFAERNELDIHVITCDPFPVMSENCDHGRLDSSKCDSVMHDSGKHDKRDNGKRVSGKRDRLLSHIQDGDTTQKMQDQLAEELIKWSCNFRNQKMKEKHRAVNADKKDTQGSEIMKKGELDHVEMTEKDTDEMCNSTNNNPDVPGGGLPVNTACQTDVTRIGNGKVSNKNSRRQSADKVALSKYEDTSYKNPVKQKTSMPGVKKKDLSERKRVKVNTKGTDASFCSHVSTSVTQALGEITSGRSQRKRKVKQFPGFNVELPSFDIKQKIDEENMQQTSFEFELDKSEKLNKKLSVGATNETALLEHNVEPDKDSKELEEKGKELKKKKIMSKKKYMEPNKKNVEPLKKNNELEKHKDKNEMHNPELEEKNMQVESVSDNSEIMEESTDLVKKGVKRMRISKFMKTKYMKSDQTGNKNLENEVEIASDAEKNQDFADSKTPSTDGLSTRSKLQSKSLRGPKSRWIQNQKRSVKNGSKEPHQIKTSKEESDTFKQKIRNKYRVQYKCLTGSCERTFRIIKNIATHKKMTHNELLRHLCSKCLKEFGTYGTYRSHLRMEHSDFQSLPFRLKNVKTEIRDEKNIIQSDILVCTKCGYRYMEMDSPIHDCEPLELCYYCPCCKYNTSDIEDMTTHIQGNHEGQYHDIKNKDRFQRLRSDAKDPGLRVRSDKTECDVCMKNCGTNEELKKHMNERHASHPFACGLCRTCYGRRNSLKRHLLTHIATHLICDICNKEFYEKVRLEAHRKTHTGERPYQCEVCGNRYCDERAVRKHLMLKHFEQYKANFPNTVASKAAETVTSPLICHLCGKTFTQERHLNRHVFKHREAYVYKCPHCDLTFDQKSDYRRHKLLHTNINLPKQGQHTEPSGGKPKDVFKGMKVIDKEHPSGLPYQCGMCEKRFRNTKSTNQHIRTVHMRDTDRKYNCHICNRGFAMISGYRNHMRLHTNSKPYQCRLCDKRYRQIAHIRQHLLFHGKPMLKCMICSRTFKSRATLRGHTNIHCTILPFKCPVRNCELAYQTLFPLLKHLSTCFKTIDVEKLECHFCRQTFTKQELVSHYHIHENDNHFKCVVCDLSFRVYPDLYFHKEKTNHFIKSELGQYNDNHGSFVNQKIVEEYPNNWSKETLMSQYDYIEDEDEQPFHKTADTESQIYTEVSKPDGDENTEGELILIAEQLTHMATTVPCREVIVQASEGTTENVTQIRIDDLDDGEIEEYEEITELQTDKLSESSMANGEIVPDSNTKTANLDEMDYQCVVENDEPINMPDKMDSEDQMNKDSIQLDIGSHELSIEENETVMEQSLTHTIELRVIDGFDESNNIELQTHEVTSEETTSVEEVIDSSVLQEDLNTEHLNSSVKFVDQTGNEIIVFVLNEDGEQIQMTDSQEILKTVVQSGNYSILQNTTSEFVQGSTDTYKPDGVDLQEDTSNSPQNEVALQQELESDIEGIVLNNNGKIIPIQHSKRQSQNRNVKGTFAKELDASFDKTVQNNLSFKASTGLYHERSKESKFECSVCKRRYRTRKAFNYHIKSHLPNNQRKYQCEHCGSGFNVPGKLTVHMRIHTKERPYKCDTCQMSFSQLGHLQTHLRKHVTNAPFQCKKCERKFVTNADLSKHMRLCHTESENLSRVQCKTCGLFYKDHLDLNIHQLRHVNEEEKQIFLSSCSTVEGYEIDERVLENIKGSAKKTTHRLYSKILICELCGACLHGEAMLKAHQLSNHTNAGDLACIICKLSFSNQTQLSKHMLTHSTECTECKICGAVVRAKLLKCHMQRHEDTTSLNYQCKKCGKQYKLEYGFMRHVMECRSDEVKELLGSSCAEPALAQDDSSGH